MTDTVVFDTLESLTKLIPPHVRTAVSIGKEAPMYRVNAPDYDRLPIDTFLIDTLMGTGGRVFEEVAVIVRPNHPERYQSEMLTPNNRLVYVCWSQQQATKQLRRPRSHVWRHVVLPSDPRHAGVAAFKLGCDTIRAWSNGPVARSAERLYEIMEVERLVVEDAWTA